MSPLSDDWCQHIPDCICWCRLHSSGSPEPSPGSRPELIADNRHLYPSAGEHGKRRFVSCSKTRKHNNLLVSKRKTKFLFAMKQTRHLGACPGLFNISEIGSKYLNVFMSHSIPVNPCDERWAELIPRGLNIYWKTTGSGWMRNTVICSQPAVIRPSAGR